MKKINEFPEIDRPREKLIKKGPSALTDTELVAALIGKGTKNSDVLETARNIVKVFDVHPSPDVNSFLDIQGVGVAKACQITAAIEFSRRRLVKPSVVISDAEDIVPLVSHISTKKQEYFVCVSLSGANEVIACRTITIGLLNSSQVHPREVFADAITDRAASVILVHNHPSGRTEPSTEDIKVTSRLVASGKILGINVLDHVIVAKDKYYSFHDNNMMNFNSITA